MPTSGTYSFKQQKNEIINAALRIVAATPINQPASATDTQNASDVLNRMIKAWMAMDIPLWKYRQVYCFLELNKSVYTLGASGDRATEEFYTTNTSTAAISGATSITVDDASNIVVGDNIGIILSTGALQWTTVDSISTNTVSLDDALTESVLSGAIVYNYTTPIPYKIQKIKQGMRINSNSNMQTPMRLIERSTYQSLTDKNSPGYPYHFYYEPRLTDGKLYVWRAAGYTDNVLSLSCVIPFQDMVGANDDFDFPVEWEEGITYNLAKRLLVFHPVDAQRAEIINSFAEDFLKAARDYDREDGAIYLVPSVYNSMYPYNNMFE